MRLVYAVLFLAFPSIAAAQPDSTDPAAYMPLAVGNEWHFQTQDATNAWTTMRLRVVGQETVEGMERWTLEQQGFRSDTPAEREEAWVAYDAAEARLVGPATAWLGVTACELDADFGGTADCFNGCDAGSVAGGRATVELDGHHVETVVKRFNDAAPCFDQYEGVAAGIGPVGFVTLGYTGTLRYAQVAGASYGQPRVPALDPTPAEDYVPLEVGDLWEYRAVDDTGLPGLELRGFVRSEVTAETDIAGRRYAVLRSTTHDHEGEPIGQVEQFVRFDADLAAPVERIDDADQPWTPPFPRLVSGGGRVGSGTLFELDCRLDSEFEAPVACSQGEGWATAAEALVLVPGRTVTGKGIRTPSVLGYVYEVVPEIGLVYAEVEEAGSAARVDLAYASVGDLEVGTPVPQLVVASESGPEAAALELRAAPNPTAGAVALRLSLDRPEAVRVDVFDALGRRVATRELALPAGSAVVELDGSRWAPGAYVVRAAAGRHHAAATVVRR